jgi:hypothetical protein
LALPFTDGVTFGMVSDSNGEHAGSSVCVCIVNSSECALKLKLLQKLPPSHEKNPMLLMITMITIHQSGRENTGSELGLGDEISGQPSLESC